jgi:hypothetical protein
METKRVAFNPNLFFSFATELMILVLAPQHKWVEEFIIQSKKIFGMFDVIVTR